MRTAVLVAVLMAGMTTAGEAQLVGGGLGAGVGASMGSSVGGVGANTGASAGVGQGGTVSDVTRASRSAAGAAQSEADATSAAAASVTPSIVGGDARSRDVRVRGGMRAAASAGSTCTDGARSYPARRAADGNYYCQPR